jgi:hypothetical protein
MDTEPRDPLSIEQIKEHRMTLLDPEDPRSMVNLVPPDVSEAMHRVPIEYFTMSEVDLKKLSRPTQVISRIRLSWWNEYNRAQEMLTHMEMVSVYAGVCHPSYFYAGILKNPRYLAWILCPPTSYLVAMEEALYFGVERLREILELPLYDEKGRANPAVGNLVLKTVALLDLRVKGAVTQKHEHKSVALNINTAARDVTNALSGASMDEINHKLSMLEAKLGKPVDSFTDVSSEDEVITITARAKTDV